MFMEKRSRRRRPRSSRRHHCKRLHRRPRLSHQWPPLPSKDKSFVFKHPFIANIQATYNPYGYLLIDLKLTTPKHLRIRTNILNTIKPKSTDRFDHFQESRPNTQTCEKAVHQPKGKFKPSGTTTARIHNVQIESEKMPSCDDCG